MGVSCLGRLLASAVVALGTAGCVLLPYGLDDPPATDSVRVAGRALDREQAFARRCHEALVKAAEPYGLTKAVTSRLEGGGTLGPIWVTASYRRRGGPESRTALIDCHVDARGEVVALTEHPNSP